MDTLDEKIVGVLVDNARATVKEIAKRVSLTSPAVSQRLHRLEETGVIAGYTVKLNPAVTRHTIRAIIAIYVAPKSFDAFHDLVSNEDSVEECYQVTGEQSHMVKACCKDVQSLNSLISRLQRLGQTNTQIILSTLRGPNMGSAGR